MAIYGYARVSSYGQLLYGSSLDEQEAELKKYGCDIIIKEQHSAKTMDRPQFQKLIKALKEGDVLVVTKLDRFSRSLIYGSKIIKDLFDRKIKIIILNMGVIEDTINGRLFLNLMLSIGSWEREMIIERTQIAKSFLKNNPNYKEGRPKKFNQMQINYALDLLSSGHSYNEVSQITSISKSTLIRAHKNKQIQDNL